MPVTSDQIQGLLGLVKSRFPDWSGFSDERLIKAEIGYKRKACAKATELLSDKEMKTLLDERRFEECIDRLHTLGKASNLLFLRVPSKGDLSILFDERLDQPSFCEKFYDLLYGPGSSTERLGRYLAYVEGHDLPSKWTFPTYFLFLTNPRTDIFVKPTRIKWLLEYMGRGQEWSSTPNPATYNALLNLASDLREALGDYGAEDMIDVQSFLWVASGVVRKTGGPGEQDDAPKSGEDDDEPTYSDSCPFSKKTFELLEAIHNNPTAAFYTENKDDFRIHVQEPFQGLLRAVGHVLPEDIRAQIEMEKRLFAKFSKNDYGRGGAWDFYWGAFYPKDGKRTTHAQLYVHIKRDLLSFGFFIGTNATTERDRFLRNLREYGDTVLREIKESPLALEYGGNDGADPNAVTPEEWLRAPEDGGFRVRMVLSREQVLRTSADGIREKILEAFTTLFPLFILASQDDPRPFLDEVEEDDLTPNEEYSLAQCADATGFTEEVLVRWVRAIERKGQAILSGPPGTGKTFVARHIAKHLVGGGFGVIDLVQFHPSYAYEDFIQGIRPEARADGTLDYPLKPGRFLQFCEEARKLKGISVLIVDEINRANLSRVFGELMYLLEYRTEDVPLAGGRRFAIPDTVRIIGTMNTADRSIALVDHALRRRFAFLELHPQYDILERFHTTNGTGFNTDRLITLLKLLNKEIDDPHYEVGISFFMLQNLSEHLEDVWRMEIEPYLVEYFFDQRDKVARFRWVEVSKRLNG